MKDGGYPLPTDINPPDSLCVQIQVPNDEGHRQAFLGALYTLTRWYNWQKDTAHNATAAADVWKLIFADVTAAMYDGMCDMFDVRQNEEEPCTLEKTEDGGETWVEWANLQLCPPKVRLNAGKIQYSTDDGATWEDAPYETGDPTTDSPLYDPLPPDANNQCIAAANAAEVYKAFYDQVAAEIATSASVATIALLIASLFAVFFTAGAAIPFVTAFVTAFIALLAGGAPEAFDPEDVDTLRCIFFDHFDSDGNIDQAGFDAVLVDVDAETDSVFPFVYLLLQYTGLPGLNNAARTNSASDPDCSDCGVEWCQTFDFTASDGGWVQEGTYSAVWYTGEGWGASVDLGSGNVDYSARSAGIKLAFGVSTTVISIEFELTAGNAANAWYGNASGGGFASPTAITTNPQTLTINYSTDGIGFLIDRANPNSMTTRISAITLRGSGTNPFGTDNC